MWLKNICFSLLVLFTGNALMAQYEEAREKYPDKGLMVFEYRVFDLGEIREDSNEVIAGFRFQNKGKAPLLITGVKPSCGCTVVNWPKDTIPPGKKGMVDVAFHPKGQDGEFNNSVFIYTNGIPYTQFLQITGTVVPKPYEVSDDFPSKLGNLMMTTTYFDFGFVYRDEIDTVEQEIYNSGDKPIKVEGIVGRPSFMQVELDNMVLEPKSRNKIRFILDAKAANDYGEAFQQITMVVNDPVVQIELHAHYNLIERFPELSARKLKKAPSIHIEPETKDYGKILQGDTAIFYYKVSNTGKNDLHIRKIQTTCGCTGWTLNTNVLKKGESTLVKVLFMTAGRVGPEEKSVTIITNDPVKPIKKVFFTAEVVTNPNALEY